MRALHRGAHGAASGLSADLLERRLERERKARQAAESLLETKSRELHHAGEALKDAANSLEAQKSQLKLILDNVQAGIVFTRADLSVRSINEAARSMFGVDASTIESMRELFVGPPDVVGWIDSLQKQPIEVDETTREAVCRRMDDREFPVEVGVKPLQHEGDTHFIWFVRDITRRTREHAKRQALEQELAQAQKFEALGTLASGVAHEINTPVQYVSDNLHFLEESLSGLSKLATHCRQTLQADPAEFEVFKSGFSQIAEEVDLDFVMSEAPQAARQSLEGLDQVASIVKAIKSFSHPGDEATVPLDLNEAISTTLTVARNRWKYVADIQTDFGDGLEGVPCHPSDISQVFLNLIVNAADAIEELGADEPGQIGIATRLDGNCAEVRISDTGCGIPAETIDKIFDPFFTTKDVGKGSGQGLAISYNIIRQKHGGTITCQSKPGKGTTFTVRLPTSPQSEHQEL